MPFRIEYGDITTYSADAVVIPANPNPTTGKGNAVDNRIYKIAGRNTLLEARKKIGNINFGEAEITSAFKFHARYIVHTVSPVWDGGDKGEDELLRSCYRNSLNKTYEKGCRSIVFPLLSTGVLRYPKDRALMIAQEACEAFLEEHSDMDITLVRYNKNIIKANDPQNGLDAYIEENSYDNLDEEEYRRLEKEWQLLPENREERMILELMRKKLARKRADEKAYN